MEEKVIIKSKQYNLKKIYLILAIVGILLTLLLVIPYAIRYANSYERYDAQFDEHLLARSCGNLYKAGEKCRECKVILEYSSKSDFVINSLLKHYSYGFIPFIVFDLLGGLVYLWLCSYELIITDKRIFGKAAWGKRVDLPVDAVSATAKIGLLKGVSVSTSSGKISFLAIKNADEIYKVVSNLLIERQQKKEQDTNSSITPKVDEADQLKKYKELLDSGVITQEEFDAKKKQLLGL